MKTVFLRHTRVAVEGLCYGRAEVPLAGTFEQEAEALRGALPAGELTYFSSPSERCMKLARFLSEEVIADERLRELNFGAWEMRPWSEVPRRELDLWAADVVRWRLPEGESFLDLSNRVMAWREETRRLFPGKTLIVVTHAGVIRTVLAHARGLPLEKAFSIEVEYGKLYPLSHYADSGKVL